MADKVDPLVGRTIEKVRLIERLGSGGMGAVYLGEHSTLEKRVAVKILADHLAKDPEFVSRFLTEAKMTSRLEHPNIVQVHDIGVADGKYFIVMQYVDGEPLQRILEAMGPLDPRDAAKVMIKVLRALHYAHGVGIVHRDVKPANIIVGKSNEPFVLDFGLAIETDSTMKLTAAGTVVGTPWYISPEQARGHRAEPRSDVYSAGVTLYTLLCGRPPFTANTALAVLNKHIHDQPVGAATLNPRIPPVLDAIVMKMLAKKPEDRYVTAETAARDLEAFLESRPISMARGSSMSLPKMPAASSRSPVFWLVGGAAVVLLSALTIVALNTEGPKFNQKDHPGPATKDGPVAPPDDARRREIDEVRKQAAKIAADYDAQREDLAVYPHIHDRYAKLRTQFANNDEALKIVDEAMRRFSEQTDARAKAFADEVSRKVQALIGDDPYAALGAYGEFPKPLLDLCPTGRAIADARAKLDAKLFREFPERLKAIDALIAAENFDGARAAAKKLLDFVPAPQQPKLRELVAKADQAEGRLRDQLLPRLAAEAEELQKRIVDPLSHGRTEDAWSTLCDYVARKPAPQLEGRLVRVAGVDYETLATLELPDMLEDDLKRRIITLSEFQLSDTPALRLLLLFEDVLWREWLQRRVSRGILRMAGSTVQLQGYGRGRLSGGDTPTFTPEGGESRPFIARELAPVNLVLLAAAADFGLDAPVAEAYAKSERVCGAAGVAYLYSTVRDRFHAAHRWIQKAKELGLPVPAFRIAAIHQELKLEEERLVRELCRPAMAHADAQRWEEAHRALDAVAQQHKDQQDLMLTLARLLEVQHAKVLLREASAAKVVKNWARVRDIVVKQLRKKYDGLYEKESADELYVEAILNLGSWTSAPVPTGDFRSQKFWVWAGKEAGAAPPAKVFEGGLRLSRNLMLLADAGSTEGYSGISAKVKLNEKRMPFSVGFIFDITSQAQTQKWLLAASDGRLSLHVFQGGRTAEKDGVALPAKIEVGDEHEIALVIEDGQIACYFDRKPLFTVEGTVTARSQLGLVAEGDFTFKQVRLRDVKPR